MEVNQIRVEDGTFQKCTVNIEIVKSTDVKMHLSVKLRGILRPKSVRTLVIGLIYGPRANK